MEFSVADSSGSQLIIDYRTNFLLGYHFTVFFVPIYAPHAQKQTRTSWFNFPLMRNCGRGSFCDGFRQRCTSVFVNVFIICLQKCDATLIAQYQRPSVLQNARKRGSESMSCTLLFFFLCARFVMAQREVATESSAMLRDAPRLYHISYFISSSAFSLTSGRVFGMSKYKLARRRQLQFPAPEVASVWVYTCARVLMV